MPEVKRERERDRKKKLLSNKRVSQSHQVKQDELNGKNTHEAAWMWFTKKVMGVVEREKCEVTMNM